MKKLPEEAAFHALLLRKFTEARDAGIGGDFDIIVTAIGCLSSRECKIETTVILGGWSKGERGEMVATTIADAFPIALERYAVNKRHNPKLLTVENGRVAVEDEF